jgi:hypothetical protein
MVLRGESRTHRFLRARLTSLVVATLVVDADAGPRHTEEESTRR